MTKTPEKKAPKGTAVEKPKAGNKPNALQQGSVKYLGQAACLSRADRPG